MKLGFVLVAAAILPCCNRPAVQQDKSSAAQSAEAASNVASWEYSEQVDKMRGTKSWTATLRSSNQPELKFPYEGGSPVYIRLFKAAGDPPDNYGPEIVLDNGQFDCSQYGGSTSCLITVKADNQKPYDLRGVSVDCGEAKCMRLLDERAIDEGGPVYGRVIKMIRQAKHLTIELPLYQYGSYQYEFDTAGLQWARETARR